MKISVITVTYNSAKTISACISSVSAQNYNDIEHIIIDGGSTDRTVEIINSQPNRVKVIVSEPDNGIYDAMNKGINLATGEIIGMLNSDDVFYDLGVIENVAYAFQHQNIDCCFGNLVFFNETGKIVRKWNSKSFKKGSFAKSWTPAHPTFYCKKELYDNYGTYKTDYKIASDVELMLRFLEVKEVRSIFLDKYLVKMMAGGVSNNGINSTITITKELQRAFRENDLPFNLIKYLFYKTLKLKEFII